MSIDRYFTFNLHNIARIEFETNNRKNSWHDLRFYDENDECVLDMGVFGPGDPAPRFVDVNAEENLQQQHWAEQQDRDEAWIAENKDL